MRYSLRSGFALAGAVMLLATALLAACGAASAAPSLGGTTWQLASVGANTARPAPSPPTLSFEDGGRVAGNAGCNQYGGSYSTGGGSLSFGAMVSTKRACVDADMMAQEAAFLKALDSVAGYTLTGNQLTLTDATGAAVLVFSRG